MTTVKKLLLVLLMAVSCIPPAAATSELNLSDYRWRYRPLLIFSPSATDVTYHALDKLLVQRATEIEDRDMIIFRIFDKSPSWVADTPMLPGDAETMRRRFGITPGRFKVVLVGKDGGVKLVADRDVDIQSIFNLIDSMPMRQQEMRDNPSIR